MKKVAITVLTALAFVSFAGSAGSIQYENGALELRLDIKGAAQGAYFDPPDAGGDSVGWNGDWSVRGSLDYVTTSGWLVGVRLEVDNDFDPESDEIGTNLTQVELDEVYGYVAGRFGRIEVGLQDGPADQMSLHAPLLGLGQIRGDFIRYAGANRALMSAYDSRDSFKVIYISPPVRGFQLGASWGPEFTANKDKPLITDQTIQKDPVELAAQYRFPAGHASVGLSGAYVFAKADPATGREDISSWSTGGDIRWRDLTVGGAYVNRGDSNFFAGFDETEINFGLEWRPGQWGLAASGATIDSSVLETRLAAFGAYVNLYKDYLQFKADAVYFEDKFSAALIPFTEDGFVLLTELEAKF